MFNKITRRAVSRAFILVFCFCLILPQRSDAILPALVPIGLALVDTAGAAAVADMTASAATGLIGMAGMGALALFGMDGAGNALAKVRVPLTTPVAPAAMPAPSAAATSPTVGSWSGGTSSFGGLYGSSSGQSSQIAAQTAACQNVVDAHPTNFYMCGNTAPTCVIGQMAYSPSCTIGVINGTSSAGQVVNCQPGYIMSGSLCVLSNPYAATQDNNQDFNRAGNAYSPIAGDLHGALSASQSTSSGGTANDTLTVTGGDAAGNPRVVNVTATANGTNITVTTNKTDANGNTYAQIDTYAIDNTGKVTSAAQQTSANGAPYSPQAPAPQVQFPSDYARAGEAAAATQPLVQLETQTNAKLDTANTKLDALHNDLSATAPVPDPITLGAGDMPGWGNTFDGLKAWTLPAHTSVCPRPVIDLDFLWGSGHQYVMDSHCALLQNNASIVYYAMVLVFTIIAIFIILRA